MLSSLRSATGILALTLCVTVATASYVSRSEAADADLRSMSCRDLPKDDLTSFMIWLDGYRAGELRSPISDESWMKYMLDILPKECAESPDTALLPIIEELIRRY